MNRGNWNCSDSDGSYMDVERRLNGREWESMSEMYVDGVHWIKGVI